MNCGNDINEIDEGENQRSKDDKIVSVYQIFSDNNLQKMCRRTIEMGFDPILVIDFSYTFTINESKIIIF